MTQDRGLYLKYIDRRFGDEALATIEQANQIIEEYDAQGLDLTLRQLYYQFVARGLIANKDREYKRLGDLVSDGRTIAATCGPISRGGRKSGSRRRPSSASSRTSAWSFGSTSSPVAGIIRRASSGALDSGSPVTCRKVRGRSYFISEITTLPAWI